jgi:hypothetical protein|tara:strand:- start:657 stop:821 length:165 start_codon:yes stop_codon:yes gene_type:complete
MLLRIGAAMRISFSVKACITLAALALEVGQLDQHHQDGWFARPGCPPRWRWLRF